MGPPSAGAGKVEAFAMDLLRLIRGARVYPANHPSLLGVADKVVAAALSDQAGLFTIGVTPRELIVSCEFVAGKASPLASLLHAKKILRIFWTRDTGPNDAWAFARLLSTPRIEGAELQRRLHCEGIFTIDIEPLELGQVHGEITDEVVDFPADPEKRRREAWMALMHHDTSPDEIASALASDQFWTNAKEAWVESGHSDAKGFADLLLDLGERLETALALLPDHKREAVLDHLARMGRTLSIPDLIRLVAREGRTTLPMGQGVASLLKEIDGERFVDLLAGLAALGEQGTRRLVEVYRRIAPATAAGELLAMVRARLALGEDSGFAAEVWKTVEEFVLKLTEAPFMDSEYSDSLDDVTDSDGPLSAENEGIELEENPEDYLDHVMLGLAAEGDAAWEKKLLQRIRDRAEKDGPFRVLGLTRLVAQVIPGLLDSNPFLVTVLFNKGLADLPRSTEAGRRALAEFTLAYERVLLDCALKALEEDGQTATRRFLVNVLSSFSSAATPVFVSKARNGGWQMARNLAIVLGRQGFPQTLPALRALSNHPHPKVQKEAQAALRHTLISRPQRPAPGIGTALAGLPDRKAPWSHTAAARPGSTPP
jgi:hypothetical protein